MKIVNPFYAALMVVGLAFVLTTSSYTVMSFRQLDPLVPDAPGLMTLMKDHGLVILLIELALLAVLTIAAIGSDEYWSKRAEK